MRKYIYKNSQKYLMVLFIWVGFFDIALTSVEARGLDNIIIIAVVLAFFQVLMISISYRVNVKVQSFNYVLSLGESRESIWKNIFLAYVNQIIIYSVVLIVINLFLQRDFVTQYIIVKTLFSFLLVPIFIHNFLELKIQYFILIPIYACLLEKNAILFVGVSISISIYLILKFRRRIMSGNLV